MITEKIIGVLAGGKSAEREVSLRSGQAVFNALKGLGYKVVFMDAAEELCETLNKENIGAAFIALHGGHGENGAVQGLLEVMGIPYTGPGVLASALAMDKEASKKIFMFHNIPVPKFIVSDCRFKRAEPDSIPFSLPWVVKPSTEGSSIGVDIVKELGEFNDASDKAYAYGPRILIEQYIKGKEIQIGVLGDIALGGVEVRPSAEFYSYEAKYTPGLTEYIMPPEVDDSVYARLKETAVKANAALGCKGATRVDFILSEDGTPYILEVNTIPGMTETSLLPKIARLAGMDFPALIENMLKSAISETA